MKQLKAAGKKSGNIVSISSQASKIGELGTGVYSISKAGVNMLTQDLGLIPVDTLPFGLSRLAVTMPVYYGCQGLKAT